jgi:hypothetical protein
MPDADFNPERLRDVWATSNSDEKPHRDPAVLRYLRHDCLLNYRPIAEAISDTFDYSIGKSTVGDAINDLGILEYDPRSHTVQYRGDTELEAVIEALEETPIVAEL